MPPQTTKQVWDSWQLPELLRKQMELFRRKDKAGKMDKVEPSNPQSENSREGLHCQEPSKAK